MRTINNLCAIITRIPDAVAFLNGSEKYKALRGQVSFYELSDSVIVRAEVSGLPEDTGDCNNSFFLHFIFTWACRAMVLQTILLQIPECITPPATVNILITWEICHHFLT